jgi:hydrogenase nickel incorporation protein HypA/HybF
MHEAALALGLIELAEDSARREKAHRIRALHVELGALSCVDPEAFAQAVDVAAMGTLAEGAQLRIDRPSGRAHCLACGDDVPLLRRDAGCPNCQSHRLLITDGEQMRLTALEVD